MNQEHKNPADISVRENGRVEEMTDSQAQELFDARARYHLDVSGDEFRRRWHAGRYDETLEDPDVAAVAMLLPLVERLPVRDRQ